MTAQRNVLALYLMLFCTATTAQQAAQSPQALVRNAMAAYDSKDFVTCAKLFDQLVENPKVKPDGLITYNAACCQSLAGNARKALSLIDRASTANTISITNVETDTDLAAMRSLPEWPALRKTLIQREEARLAGLNRELRTELLRREVLDQDIRKRATAAGNPLPKDLSEEWQRIDQDNTEWMKTVLARYGWPGKSLVGDDGSKAAWLFVQHADRDKPFQKDAIKLLEVAAAKGEASGQDLAYLVDRILVNEGNPQRYGTQYHEVDGKLVPQPIEDAKHVDDRRESVGMGTLADYDRQIQANFGASATEKKTTPADPAPQSAPAPAAH